MAAVDNFTVSLIIVGDDLDPDEVTALLDCTPTRAYRKGDPWSERHPERHRPHGAWILETTRDRGVGVEAHIEHLLDQVSNDAAIWRHINARFCSRIFCGIFMDCWNEGFGLAPDVLARLSASGLHLDFDLYAPTEDDEPDGDSE